MQNPQDTRRIPTSLVAGVSVVMLAAGAGGAWWAWNRTTASPPQSEVPTLSQSPQDTPPATEQKVQVYWVDDVNNQIELVPSSITVENADNPSEALEMAFQQLLAGPEEEAIASAIPEETQLRNLSVKSDGVHLDLSEDFTTGGGSASMQSRLGQIIYTATSLDPDAQVWIDVGGKPLEVLGGEGLIVDQPMTRQDFETNFPL
ncbi:MAG: GerMN domain-containing protein [Coleofasciculus sp. G1-WW12-02]|uniref:GerMN domain-containing protein n=1 Tax=unclassified Coleofasciculus TaxID=2692782 RepID=UPI003302C0F9